MENSGINIGEINPIVLKAIGLTGDSKTEVAEKIGVTSMTFTQIKKEKSMPSFTTIGMLRKVYGISIDAIVDGNMDGLMGNKAKDPRITELENKLSLIEEQKRVLEAKLQSVQEKLIGMYDEEKRNFPEVCTSSQLVDKLDYFASIGHEEPIQNIKPETQEPYTGGEFKKGKIVFAEA